MTLIEVLPAASLLISVSAFFRPEIAKILTRAFGGIEFYPPESIELGYNAFGPTIDINGAYRSRYGTIFLRKAALVVTGPNSQAEHQFGWKAFRKLNYLDRAKSELELPTTMAIHDSDARRIDIFFSDGAVFSRMEGPLKKFRDDVMKAAAARTLTDLSSANAQSVADRYRRGKNGENIEALSALTNGFYWRSGKYEMQLKLFVLGRNSPKQFRYSFVLTDEDVNGLTANFELVLREITGVSGIMYAFAYPHIET